MLHRGRERVRETDRQKDRQTEMDRERERERERDSKTHIEAVSEDAEVADPAQPVTHCGQVDQ